MNLNNLSTSSSKASRSKMILEAFKTGLWFLGFLLLFDIAINILFPYPSDPRNTSPGQLNLYFDYGRSTESKINRQVGPTDATSAPIAQAGWLNPQEWKPLPARPKKTENLLIACYGMSFSNQVCEAMKAIDPHLDLRMIAGPGSPPNHSFAAYTLDRGHHQAGVAIWGILASSVKGLSTMSGMTMGSEVPPPFTFPKYFIEDGKLQAIWPDIQSLEKLRVAKQNHQQWKEFVTQLREHDRFFDPFVFEHNFLDNSAMVRMLRRVWTQRHQGKLTEQIYTAEGFKQNWPELDTLRLMVKEFAATARADNKLPIILLLNDRGYNDHLYQVLKPALEEASIPYVSTHTIAPASNLNNFVGDGHFTPSANKLIAKALLNLINAHLKQ